MQIRTLQDGEEVYVTPDIVCASLGEYKFPITLLIDTGAGVTTISPMDAADNYFNFSNFKKSRNPSWGVGGRQKCEYYMEDVYFRFHTTNNKFVIKHLDKVDVIRPRKSKKINPMPSLLGTDLLKDLKFTYNSKAKLEEK